MKEQGKKVIALTGASGNMGTETLRQLLESDCVEKVRVLLINKRRERSFAAKWKRQYKKRIEIFFGDISRFSDCENFIRGAHYVLNLAAVIPPRSDHHLELARKANLVGAKNIVEAVEKAGEIQPKLIHISSVAVYGNRNHLHPWGRVGDPLLPSAYDCYASYKTLGERFVLDSSIKTWVVLRQTAMLHQKMLTDNMKDGLMFHTCFNAPLEWVTARDSGRLLTIIVEKDIVCGIDGFWKKVFNIGGGAQNRSTGFDIFDEGFNIIGGSAQSFLRPYWNATRNFHGLWFYDSDKLQELFSFQKESISCYWKEVLDRHLYYKIAKIFPPSLISKCAIQRLLNDKNSPQRWVKSKDLGKVTAYFSSEEDAKNLPKDWKDFPILSKGQLANGKVDYEELRNIEKVKENGLLLNHGYDESKNDGELDIEDMRGAAQFRGGKCLSENMTRGDLYSPLEWQCHDGHRFFASPYTVLKAGHWCTECCVPKTWDFDRLAKHNPFYAQVWYDSHSQDENYFYYFDGNRARFINNSLNIRFKNAVLYVFSGTGNTKKIADIYAAELEKVGIKTTVYPLTEGFPDMPKVEDFDLVGFAHPVHGFNSPSIMLKLAKLLPAQNNKRFFLFKSSGEPLKLNNAASLRFISILKKKGYILTNEYNYVMPYNIIFRHDDGMAAKMWNAAKDRVPKDVKEILNENPYTLSKVPFGALISAAFRIEHPAVKVNGRFFKVDQTKCISCGKCINACPQKNITDENGKIVFGKNCIMCAACVFRCPEDAISIGILNGWKVNGEYDFNAEEKYQSGRHQNYCKKAYRNYFNDCDDTNGSDAV